MDTLLLWGFGLLSIAALLFLIEVFIPSGGILGFVSFAVAIAGVVAFWRYSTMWGATSTLVVIVMVPICFNFALRIIPHTPIGRRLILGETTPDDENIAAPIPAHQDHSSLIGTEAIVLTELRPVGEVRVNGERFEGHAEEGIIASGSRVRVIGVEGDRLTVRAV